MNRYQKEEQIKESYQKNLPEPNQKWTPVVQRAFTCINAHLYDEQLTITWIKDQCQMQAIANLAVISDSSSQVNFNLITILMDPTCEPAAFRNGRYIIVVYSDCSVIRIKLKKG